MCAGVGNRQVSGREGLGGGGRSWYTNSRRVGIFCLFVCFNVLFQHWLSAKSRMLTFLCV